MLLTGCTSQDPLEGDLYITGKYYSDGKEVGAGSNYEVFTTTEDGLVPAPGASTGDFLKDDGTWDTPASAGNVTNPLTADLDFAEYKAIAMSCDNGATIPASPSTGQWFLHTPTGRKILYQYSGTAWIPIISMGTMTVYVDSTDGTDDTAHGTGVNADAFKTIQYSVNMIPGLVGGDVAIYINNETYGEWVTIRGKKVIGDYTITIDGTLNAHATNAQESSVQGATTTFGSITDTGEFTGHANDLLYSSNNAETRIIDTVTADSATVVGYWTAAPAGNYTIYQWGTTVTSMKLSMGQQNIEITEMYISDTLEIDIGAELNCYRTKIGTLVNNLGKTILNQCLFLSSSNSLVSNTQSNLGLVGSKISSTWAGGSGLHTFDSYVLFMTQPSVIDLNSTALIAVYAELGSVIDFGALYNKIRDDVGGGGGVYATNHGHCYYTANNQYSGLTTNELAIAASYSYID